MNSPVVRSRFRIREVLAWIAFAALAAGTVGCGRSGPDSAAAPPPSQVTVAPVEQRELVEWDEFTGRAAAVEFVEVRPRVSGHVQKVRFDSGQLVKKGDVLFEIDNRWHQADFERREAEIAVAQVRMETAEREAKRTAQLLASKAISNEEADARQARYAEARAEWLAAKAARDSVQLDLEHTVIRSPIDGRVSRALVTAGNYVSGLAGAATLLTTIVSVDPIYVYADMDEAALLRYRALILDGSLPVDDQGRVPVQLQLSDESTFATIGFLESLDNRIDEKTGSIVLRAQFPNADGRIVPGLFARLRVPAGPREPKLLIEETAIGTDQAQKYVLTLTSTNTTAYRPVKLGPVVGGKRIIRDGVRAGEKVVVNGLARIRPGMPVEPQEAPVMAGGASGPRTAAR
ncbi:MAG: efflux RND transporter periplasmic adaptor subunit [Verrucomicrobiales bacterium]|nr:efflux RND transporter periplasmic adaptor subunit [Verrucomicrobiales bacterium]